MWVDDGLYSTLTEFILLIRGRKLDGSRRKVISRDWRNLFIPVKSVCGLGTTYAQIRPWSFLEPKILLDLVCTKLYCFRASVDCYHCLYIFSANPVRRSEELSSDPQPKPHANINIKYKKTNNARKKIMASYSKDDNFFLSEPLIITAKPLQQHFNKTRAEIIKHLENCSV